MLDLRDKIASLSMDEKVYLLDAVWESLESDASSLSNAQRAELDRRIDQHQQHPSDVIPWEQVQTRLSDRSFGFPKQPKN